MKCWLTIVCICCWLCTAAQGSYPFQQAFEEAYTQHPGIPSGMLQAVAWNYTHMQHLTATQEASCVGLPEYYTPMGLVADGQGFFRNNLAVVSQLSGFTQEAILSSAALSIQAYAAAFAHLQDSLGITSSHPADNLPVLLALSELPQPTNLSSDFALNSQLYVIYAFLNNPAMQQRFGFQSAAVDMPLLFGSNYAVLSAPSVTLAPAHIQNQQGQAYGQSRLSTDYGPAIWNPASSCNYSSRNGAAITAVTIHTIQGTYASAINWFQNCNAGVSAHYVIRSSDGQVTQMVLEGEKGWHVGSENSYTIGIEHEGYVTDPSWYTTAMYQSSANLVKDIVGSGYGIPPLSTYKGTAQGVVNACYRIKAHSHFPNQTHTDPGVHWNWLYYHQLINDTIFTEHKYTCSGTLTDNGGSGNYQDLTRYVTVIEPPGADSVVMAFSVFDLENGYDSLYVYDGGDTSAPIIGGYTGQAGPGTFTAYSGKVTLLFTSDCVINGAGYLASWQCGNCPPMLLSALNVVPAGCSADGSADLRVTGGSAPYVFTWPDGNNSTTRTDLPSGTYSVTVSDQNNCSTIADVVIPSTQSLLADALVQPATCSGMPNGYASLQVTTGTAPYTYLWGNGITDAIRDDLPAGVFSYTVTDAQGCTTSGTVQITEPAPLEIDAQFLASGDTAFILGGTPPYTYSQNCVYLTDTLCQLQIADANGCTWDSLVAKVGFVPVGLAAADMPAIKVYPNPANHWLTIEGAPQQCMLLLFNALGQQVVAQSITTPRQTINISSLPTGMYIYQLQRTNQTLSQGRVVKEE